MKTILTTTLALSVCTVLGSFQPAEALRPIPQARASEQGHLHLARHHRHHRRHSTSFYFNTAPAVSYYAPPPVTYYAPTPVISYPQPAVTYYAPPPPQPMYYYSQPAYIQAPCYEYVQPGFGLSFSIFN